MKFRHLLYPLALYIGFNYVDIITPITYPATPYQTIKNWKAQHRLQASQIGTDIPRDANYACKMVTDLAWTCDYRINITI